MLDVLTGECVSSPSRWQRSIRPIATPATVGCTPLSCISAQMTTASGTNRYQPCTPRRCRNQNSTRPASESPSAQNLMPEL